MIQINHTNEIYSKRNILIWIISTFKAGFINSAGFLLTGKFVSHVTGFGTQVGVAVGHHDYFFGIELLIIPISFIFGGVVTSVALDKKYDDNEKPKYFIIQGLITVLIALVIILWEYNLNSTTESFDKDLSYGPVEFIVISLLCFICGLKNSLITWATFGKIRVTHLTGLSTDIGLNILRLFKKDFYSPRFQEQKIVMIVRLFTLFSFSLGAFISAIFFSKIGHYVFLFVLFLSFFMTLLSIYDWKKHTEEIDEANQVQIS